jgi:hypothetical protein
MIAERRAIIGAAVPCSLVKSAPQIATFSGLLCG